MPDELKDEGNFNKAVSNYQEKIVKEPYQPLSDLLTTLKNLCKSNLEHLKVETQLE